MANSPVDLKFTKHRTGSRGWTTWIPAADTHYIACCDCLLVHQFEFRVTKGRVQFRAKRHAALTKARRAGKRKGKSDGDAST